MIRLSIVTPVLNGERYLAGCIRNVIDQHVDGLEHIIVDGGSSDATIAIARDWQKAHGHIRLVEGPDRGQSDAMNKGIRAARAPIIGFLNCDDFYAPNAVAEALAIIETLPSPSFVVGNTRMINVEGQTISWNRPRDLRLESAVLGWRYTSPPYNPSAYFYHKTVHDLIGLYDTSDHYTMDQTFLFDCMRARINMVYVDRHWGNFRLQPGAKTYEDQQAGTSHARSRSLYDRYRAEFTLQQRVKMYAILAGKIPRRWLWLVREQLKRAAALQALR